MFRTLSNLNDAVETAEKSKTQADNAVAEINELIQKATDAGSEGDFLEDLYNYLNGKEKLGQ